MCMCVRARNPGPGLQLDLSEKLGVVMRERDELGALARARESELKHYKSTTFDANDKQGKQQEESELDRVRRESLDALKALKQSKERIDKLTETARRGKEEWAAAIKQIEESVSVSRERKRGQPPPKGSSGLRPLFDRRIDDPDDKARPWRAKKGTAADQLHKLLEPESGVLKPDKQLLALVEVYDEAVAATEAQRDAEAAKAESLEKEAKRVREESDLRFGSEQGRLGVCVALLRGELTAYEVEAHAEIGDREGKIRDLRRELRDVEGVAKEKAGVESRRLQGMLEAKEAELAQLRSELERRTGEAANADDAHRQEAARLKALLEKMHGQLRSYTAALSKTSAAGRHGGYYFGGAPSLQWQTKADRGLIEMLPPGSPGSAGSPGSREGSPGRSGSPLPDGSSPTGRERAGGRSIPDLNESSDASGAVRRSLASASSAAAAAVAAAHGRHSPLRGLYDRPTGPRSSYEPRSPSARPRSLSPSEREGLAERWRPTAGRDAGSRPISPEPRGAIAGSQAASAGLAARALAEQRPSSAGPLAAAVGGGGVPRRPGSLGAAEGTGAGVSGRGGAGDARAGVLGVGGGGGRFGGGGDGGRGAGVGVGAPAAPASAQSFAQPAGAGPSEVLASAAGGGSDGQMAARGTPPPRPHLSVRVGEDDTTTAGGRPLASVLPTLAGAAGDASDGTGADAIAIASGATADPGGSGPLEGRPAASPFSSPDGGKAGGSKLTDSLGKKKRLVKPAGPLNLSGKNVAAGSGQMSVRAGGAGGAGGGAGGGASTEREPQPSSRSPPKALKAKGRGR